jgi:hypothetical protein
MGVCMNNTEFQEKLKDMYAKAHIDMRTNNTLNELVYVLRMSGEDYQLNTYDVNEPGSCTCIPDLKETFIPIKSLAQKVVSVKFDEETYEEMGIQLLLIKVKD